MTDLQLSFKDIGLHRSKILLSVQQKALKTYIQTKSNFDSSIQYLYDYESYNNKTNFTLDPFKITL